MTGTLLNRYEHPNIELKFPEVSSKTLTHRAQRWKRSDFSCSLIPPGKQISRKYI